jgi:Flp pilus assembly protein TadG
MRMRNRFRLLRDEHAASLLEFAAVMPLFMLLMLGSVDFGRAFYVEIQVAGAADAAAAYGASNPTDTTGMTNAAQDDAPNVPNLSVGTPTSGCECSDGTGYVASPCTTPPTCSGTTNEVVLTKVKVTATYKPLFPWPGIPSSIPFSSTASMRSGGS